MDEADQIQEKVAKKRANNRKRREEQGGHRRGKVPNFGDKTLAEAVGQQSCRQTGKNIVNWYTVQRWFRREIKEINEDWLVVKGGDDSEQKQTWWSWPEKNCAERLLKHYGPEIVERAVKWFVKNWQAMKDRSDGELTGSPSVRLLWASRERIFADAEAGVVVKPYKKRKSRKRKRIESSEYDDESASKMPGIGW